ncbi:hypothetical protein B0H14DRAFT_3431727 [Mycena olivaceomarginata]|nr:hypothetical protein B0H14DRAFT_3431727 [Mycena olivaceomarginata]
MTTLSTKTEEIALPPVNDDSGTGSSGSCVVCREDTDLPPVNEDSGTGQTPSLPFQPFPPVRRVITGHTPAGKSTVITDTVQPARFIRLESPAESPAVIGTEISTGEWVDEGQVSPLHRTVTLDYAIVFRGSVVLELEEGERITLNEGDTWRNETTEWAKLYFVMTEAKPIKIVGKTLREEFHKAE